jgi:hypothetical protein
MDHDYADYLGKSRRLTILRILSEMPGALTNSSVLDGMLERFGHSASRNVVCDDMRFLRQKGLIELTEAGSVLVGKLTQLGLDVSTGEEAVEGVARPRQVLP